VLSKPTEKVSRAWGAQKNKKERTHDWKEARVRAKSTVIRTPYYRVAKSVMRYMRWMIDDALAIRTWNLEL
jgi:hypothetical protein